MRAHAPDAAGHVHVAGTEIWWERFGTGGPALLFYGGDTIVDSHMWKGQVGWFAGRHTVLAFDPPGNGRSSRTTDPHAYSDEVLLAAALGVLDAAGVDRAVAVGVCSGAGLSLLLAAEHPERVLGVVAINPGVRLTPPHSHRNVAHFDTVLDDHPGWLKENRHYWLRDWPGFADFFFDQLLPEPHSTKHHDDAVGWACGTTAEMMLSDHGGTSRRGDPESAAEICRRVVCPVLVINGDQDMCQPPERSRIVAELTGAELLVIAGSGHLPHARDPVRVNLAIADFLRRL
jgi:pimeloyl-ACP methyl ester carboxylesterase